MKKQMLSGAMLLGVAVLALSAWPLPAEAQTTFGAQANQQEEQALLMKVLQARDPQERVTLAEEFLAKYAESPLRAQAYAAAAEAYEMQNNFDKAVEYGEKALELSPRFAGAMILVADALALGALPTQLDYEQRLTKAEDYARRALEILPEMLATRPRRPDVPEEQYELQKKYFEAQPHAVLGLVYLRRNQSQQAEEELKLATELNQMRPEAVDFQRLGIAHLRQREYADAVTAFERCVELGGPATADCRRRADDAQRRLQAEPSPEPKPQE